MRYLFVVQGEGRGHMTQAMTLEKMLARNGHEVVGIMVGTSATRKVPEFFLRSVSAPVTEYTSMNFRPSHKNRKPNMIGTVLYNVFAFVKYFPSIRRIRKTAIESRADVVVNFYELLVGLAYMGRRLKVPCVSIGHQYLFLHKGFGLPLVKYPGHEGLNVLSRINSFGSCKLLALSFNHLPDDSSRRIKVVPPLLRPDVLRLRNSDGSAGESVCRGDYILGYMLNPGFAPEVEAWHSGHPDVNLRFFWDKWSEGPVRKVDDNLSFYPIDDKEFLHQMAGCGAYASTAGFESVCEAMYLGKPILMVPSHIEQEINAFDATRNGAGISAKTFDLSALIEFAKDYHQNDGFIEWVNSAEKIILKELTEDIH